MSVVVTSFLANAEQQLNFIQDAASRSTLRKHKRNLYAYIPLLDLLLVIDAISVHLRQPQRALRLRRPLGMYGSFKGLW